MTSRVLVFGERGQLGQQLLGADVRGMMIRGADGTDITDADAVAAIMDRVMPHSVLNCAAYTGVDAAEDESERAFAVNRDGAEIVAAACAARDVRLTHVSTDFVFSGTRQTPYPPDAEHGAAGIYGRSKSEGETAVRQACERAAIVRTSWVYSPYRHNFVKAMLSLMRSGRDLNVVDDQRGAPTWTRDLAATLIEVARTGWTGTGHWSDAGQCSWYEFAVEIQRQALDAGSLETPVSIRPVSTAHYAELIGRTLAPRPAYSVLDSSLIAADLGLTPRPWAECLAGMLAEEATLAAASARRKE